MSPPAEEQKFGMDSLLGRPFAGGAVGAVRLALELTAFSFAPAAIGQRRRIRGGFSFDFAGLADSNPSAIRQPIRAVHSHHFSSLETTLDIGSGLVGCQNLNRADMRGLMLIDN